MKNHIKYAALAALAVTALVLGANAQAPGGPGGGGRGGFMDDTQRQAFRDALQKNQDEIQKLSDKLREAQKELMKAVLADKFDEKVVREKADAVGKIQTEMILLRGKALSSVASTMKPEQRDQLVNSQFSFMMLMGGFGGGPGGRGGPGGGPPGGGQGGGQGGGRGGRGGGGGGGGGGNR